jgi:ABC-type lipoprotein export system ATPase subunit
MTPLVSVRDVRKAFGGLRPLRLNALDVHAGQRVTLRGFDAAAAEMCVLLMTGAAVPDEGVVTIDGRDTRAIATDTEWLSSLDLFGMVTRRAVLLDTLTVEANLALPFTLSLDPMPEDVRRAVAALADETGLGRERLATSVQSLSAGDRARVHLARALAQDPRLLIVEHITSEMTAADAAALAATLASVADDRGLAWLVFSEDDALVAGLGGDARVLDPATGDWRATPSQVTTW